MSLCAICPEPGHCCRVIRLNGGTKPTDQVRTIEEAEEELAHYNRVVLLRGGPFDHLLPFRPLYKDSRGRWVNWCPNLDLETGRCNDYKHRPFACQNYQPGCDRNCVWHEPIYVSNTDGVLKDPEDQEPEPWTTLEDLCREASEW